MYRSFAAHTGQCTTWRTFIIYITGGVILHSQGYSSCWMVPTRPWRVWNHCQCSRVYGQCMECIHPTPAQSLNIVCCQVKTCWPTLCSRILHIATNALHSRQNAPTTQMDTRNTWSLMSSSQDEMSTWGRQSVTFSSRPARQQIAVLSLHLVQVGLVYLIVFI